MNSKKGENAPTFCVFHGRLMLKQTEYPILRLTPNFPCPGFPLHRVPSARSLSCHRGSLWERIRAHPCAVLLPATSSLSHHTALATIVGSFPFCMCIPVFFFSSLLLHLLHCLCCACVCVRLFYTLLFIWLPLHPSPSFTRSFTSTLLSSFSSA